MMYKNLEIIKLFHAAVKIKGAGLTIFVDPLQLPAAEVEPADYIFITHEHHDHLSPEDIKKISTANTTIISIDLAKERLAEIAAKEILFVKPGDTLKLDKLTAEAVPAYNINKFRAPGVPFHPKEHGMVGFVIEIDGVRIYHAGDTDFIPEMNNLKNIDVVLLPISGTFVMTAEESSEAANAIQPKLAVPIHYGDLVMEDKVLGAKEEGERFKKLARVPVEIL